MRNRMLGLLKYGWPFAVVLVLWYVSLRFVPSWFGVPKGSGEFGDMFGAVNALFSGLAFAGVILTIWMQKEELELQREELKQTRDEIRGQKEQMALQNETTRKQQFEATFFKLVSARSLELQKLRLGLDPQNNASEIEGLLHYEPSGTPYLQGADVIGFLIRNEILPELGTATNENAGKLVKEIATAFRKKELYYSNLLGPYLGSTLSLYEYLYKHADITNADFYRRHARLKQSPSEAMLLAVYAAFAVRAKDYKMIITEFGLLAGFESANPLTIAIVEKATQSHE